MYLYGLYVFSTLANHVSQSIVFVAAVCKLLSLNCKTRKRSTTRLEQLIITSQRCPRYGQYIRGKGFPTSRPAKAKHPQVHLSGPKGFRYIESEKIAILKYSSNIFATMRSSVNICLCALAAGSAVHAQDAYAQQPGDADLLSDINVISRYWGALHNSPYMQHH